MNEVQSRVFFYTKQQLINKTIEKDISCVFKMYSCFFQGRCKGAKNYRAQLDYAGKSCPRDLLVDDGGLIDLVDVSVVVNGFWCGYSLEANS